MSAVKRWLVVLMPVLAVSLLALGGCGKKDEGGGKASGDGKGASGPGKKGGAAEAKVTGHATAVKGKVTYAGPADKMVINKIKPSKDADKCPADLEVEGWYVKDPAAKGIRYAVVFLKAPSGTRMPKDDGKNKPSSPVVELKQPKCMFEPRVQVLHPDQKLKAFNDSTIVHDTNLGGPNEYKKTMPPGETYEFSPDPSNNEPYKLSCGIHAGMMSGYVWKFDHPWAAVTDENGNFEIKNVPVLEGSPLEIWVWHEMLPDNKMKKVGVVEAKAGETATKDFTIPE
jgi:hypothetical protein